ncbi:MULTISPECIES: NAD(P)-dependent oxidoreductase [Achromobacter]|jgi:3-hydroxyisobutyrate dehydrogenase-like beta-hydroxyacid dehydrogenase|nr:MULTISPECIES: NAD(P)-dependent oxidoreductase [Achromobacter]MEB3097646.1 NAD(P)-binding domain-containing protein [Achromobacter sp. D10]OAD16361.1 6-phosphogluconate dehydrogenase [Achromobacter insolitus]QEK92384.1 NAD(P)-dependent oxidoreductase [Achromobacter insolitus]
MKIALMGCGEVGSCYAQAWTAAGHAVVGICELRQDEEMTGRARSLGAGLHAEPGAWLAEADVVVSAVYGHAALEIARRSFPHMRPDAVYADFTTASAPDMQAAAAAAAERHIDFTDVAIMGAIALLAERTPLLCAGTGTDMVLRLAESGGAPARAIQGAAGDAVRLKLLRSIMTKGMESLAVECLVAAESMGLRASLYEVLADIDQTPLTAFMDSFVRSHVLHAQRRQAEVREAREQLLQAGLEPLVLDGVERLFGRTSRGILNARADGDFNLPDSVEARLAWLTTLARER